MVLESRSRELLTGRKEAVRTKAVWENSPFTPDTVISATKVCGDSVLLPSGASALAELSDEVASLPSSVRSPVGQEAQLAKPFHFKDSLI